MTLLRPEWMLALPPLLALAVWLWRRDRGLGDWARVADADMLAAMRALGRVDAGGGNRAALWPLVAALLVALALAGPAVQRAGGHAFRNLDGAVVVLDASPSMTGGAGWTDAVAAARVALGALGARPAALVVYAGDAYLAQPFTDDTASLGLSAALVAPGTVPDPGSRPERALALAARLIAEARILAGDVVLVTDGGGLGPEALAGAAALQAAGARLWLVDAGAADGAALAALAEAGGGAVFPARELAGLRAALATGADARLDRRAFALIFWQDFGRWLIAAALIPLALTFRRGLA